MTTKSELLSWLKTSTARRVVLVEVENVLYSNGNLLGNFYFSNKPYGTTNLDVPINTNYTAAITGGVTFSETLELTGSASIGYGDIQLDNTNGIRDELLTYVWANKPIKVYIGDASWPKLNFYQIFNGYVNDIESRDRNTLNLILVDRLQQLNVAVTDVLMGGTGASKDQLKPLCFGECFNITPVVSDSSTLTYQVHNGPIEDVIEVRDSGLQVNIDQTTLQQDLNAGIFKLKASPFGVITASVQGGRYGSPTATYSSKVATVIQNLLLNYGKTVSANDIDTTSFTENNTQDVGVYLTQRENLLDICQKLANGCGLSLTTNLEGKFKLVKLKVDETSGEQHSVSASDMQEKSLTIGQKVPVKGGIKLGYCKNWTVQTSGLAAAIDPDAGTIFGRDYYTISVKDTEVLNRYNQTAEQPLQESLLISNVNATAEANRLLTIYKTPRFVYTATYYAHLLVCELGDLVKITHPRFDLDNGKIGTAVSIQRDWLNGRVTIGILV
jgi:hypothetical protein